MTEIDAAMRAVLIADAGVNALVSGRVYFDMVPLDSTLPAITLTLVSNIPDKTVPDLWRARVQCSCWSNPVSQNGVKSPAEVSAMADAVKAAVNRTTLEKEVESWSIGSKSYSVHTVRVENAPRLFDQSSDWYHSPVDVLIDYRKVS